MRGVNDNSDIVMLKPEHFCTMEVQGIDHEILEEIKSSMHRELQVQKQLTLKAPGWQEANGIITWEH